MKIGFIAAAAGLAVGTALCASPLEDFRALGPDGFRAPNSEIPVNTMGFVPESETVFIGVESGFGNLARGSYGERGNPVVTMSADFDDLALIPTPLSGQQANATWTNHPLDNSTQLAMFGQGQPFSGAVDTPVGGNTSTKLRLFTNFVPAPGFYFGWALDTILQFTTMPPMNNAVELFSFAPDTGVPLRASIEVFNTGTTELHTSETVFGTSGFISTRLLWGGTSTGGSIPAGPIEFIYFLGQDPDSFTSGLFVVCEYMGSAPAGSNVGDPVQFPVNSWHRLVHEFTADNIVNTYIDFLDGQGEFLIMERPVWLSPFVDSMGSNSSFQTQGQTVFFDNVNIVGIQRILPVAPPLECDEMTDQYVDDMEWLNAGQLRGQSPRWFDALSSGAAVINVGGSQMIRQRNVFIDDFFREEFRTNLPTSVAAGGQSFQLCVEAHVSAGNTTIRGISARATASSSPLADNLTFRHFVGYSDPNDPVNPFYQTGLYTQLNPSFDYTEVGTNPFDNIPVLGTDLMLIGPFASGGSNKNVCTTINEFEDMDVTVDGTPYGSGLSAFRTTIVRASFESRNDNSGFNNDFRIDNLVLSCSTLPDVTFPDFEIIYDDDLEWAIPNVIIGQQGDGSGDGRWGSSANAIVRDLGAKTQVLEMENRFLDTDPLPPDDPDFIFFTAAFTNLPEVIASSTRGYVVSGRYKLTDGTTTRLWTIFTDSEVDGDFISVSGRLAYSSVTQTFWVQGPDPDDDLTAMPPVINPPVWINTGKSLSDFPGVGFNTWFKLTIHFNLSGQYTFRINNRLLTDSSNNPLVVDARRAVDGNGNLFIRKDLARLTIGIGDENTATPGSTMYVDDIRVWALPCQGDTNFDGVVEFADLSNVLATFGQTGPNLIGNIAPDSNGDGVPDDNTVGFPDLAAVLGGIGIVCD
ncbi:MAG: hypothetical protein EA379_06950 [Phycisphaerales bacterium]|nr:MAG: hypothetical protein EA379_06950 [Phycisphaerales bacterium]